jgi:putative oxidoreductase
MQKTHKLSNGQIVFEHEDISDYLISRKTDIGLLLLRLTIGVLMLLHGLHKMIYGNQGVENILAGVGLPIFFSFGVFLGEVLGPILIILGYKTRIGAAVIAIDMFIAAVLVHVTQIRAINESGGWMLELNGLYFFGALSILLLGSGKMAISQGRGPLD